MVQTLHELFRLEMRFSGRTRNVESYHAGRQGDSDRYTDGRAWGSPHTEAKMASDVSKVEPNSSSYSKRSGSVRNQSFLSVNAGIRDSERTI